MAVTYGLNGIVGIVQATGSYAHFCGQTIIRTFFPPVRLNLLLRQMDFVGNRSFLIIVMAGAMVGAIFGFQLGEIFRIFGTESMIGASASLALARELAPVVGAFLVTGRAGSSMAAEIATMRVNEQIDAMRVMSVNPYGYLMAPRVLASVLMMPVLAVFFVIAGVTAAYVIGAAFYDIDPAEFLSKIQWIVKMNDLWQGMEKAAVFGFIFSSVGCYRGFIARGGAKGVGRATTLAVVISYVAILVVDFLMSFIQYRSNQSGLFG